MSILNERRLEWEKQGGNDPRDENGMLPINHPASAWTTAADLPVRKERAERPDIHTERPAGCVRETYTEDFETHEDLTTIEYTAPRWDSHSSLDGDED